MEVFKRLMLNEAAVLNPARPYGTATTDESLLSYETVKARLDALPLAQAIEEACDLLDCGRVDAIFVRIVRYVANRIEAEHARETPPA